MTHSNVALILYNNRKLYAFHKIELRFFFIWKFKSIVSVSIMMDWRFIVWCQSYLEIGLTQILDSLIMIFKYLLVIYMHRMTKFKGALIFFFSATSHSNKGSYYSEIWKSSNKSYIGYEKRELRSRSLYLIMLLLLLLIN